MVRLLSFIFFAFVFSCTIIEDSDITSQEELDNLVFSAIEISQEMTSGNTTSTATVTSIAVVNIPVSVPPFNGTITKQVYMDWPALTANSKLKLKSGDVTPFKSRTSYLSSGQPYTFYLFHVSGSDTIIFELYRFRYDASGRLNKILTNAPFVEGGPPTSNDTLIYGNPSNSKEITSILRRSSDPTKAGTFSISSGSIFSSGWSFDFKNMRYTKVCQGGGCGPWWGGNYDVIPGVTGFPSGVMNLTTLQKEHLTIEDRNHSLEQWGCGNCIRYVDTFYFHPLMVLKDNFELGDQLLFIYMVDWWQPISSQESSENEAVIFTYKYDL